MVRDKNTEQRSQRQRRLRSLWIAAAIILLIIVGMVILERGQQFHPYIIFQSRDSIKVTYLHQGRSNRAECETIVKNISLAIKTACKSCLLLENICLEKLNSWQQKILYGQAVDVPVMRISSGAAAFIATTPDLAMYTCEESARQTERNLPGSTQCMSAAIESTALSRTNVSGIVDSASMPKFSDLICITLLSMAIALLVSYLIIRSEKLHQRFSHDKIKTGPQKFHATASPRIGGLALAAALAGSIFAMGMLPLLKSTAVEGLYMLALAALPAFAGGFGEDVTKQVSVLARLMLTATSGIIASLLVGTTLDRLDVPGLDILLQWPIFAIAFTAFAVSGIANAINIIDGYHGLVGGYSLLVLAALAYVAAQVGDPVVITASLVMAGAVLGFLIWNYPRGRIFLGDGGAYLLGFWLAELSILLVVRNPDVSPWFPLLLLSYPIYETLFSIYRKKLIMGRSPGQPDGLHFQMLIYKRMVRFFVSSRAPALRTIRNSLVAPYIWIMSIIFFIPALVFWNQSGRLAMLALIFCILYTLIYWRIVRWKSPTWLLIRRK